MTPSIRWPIRTAAIAVLLAVAATLSAGPASAQYFGRNKVQYRTFDFQVLKTPHFDVYYYPEEEVAARDAARMAERWYARLSRVLDYRFEERQPVVLYANHAEFQQTNTLGGQIGEGTGGVTEAYKQRVVLPFTGSYQEFDHVLGHELVHAFQYDISGLGRAGGGLEAAARRFNVPLWFVEGMAEYLSVGPVDAHTAMWLRDAALTGDLPSVEQLSTDPRIFPYRYGHALWAYIGGRWGDAVIGQILKLVGEGVPYEEAFQRLLNVELDEIGEDWQASIRRAYLPLLAERPEAREIARPLITNEKRGGRLNLAPALSPDGKWLAFISELDFFDVELWLADAETGKVVRKLVKGTASDAHFGSLRFIASAGTFSPDGRRLAFSALRQGRDVMVILDVRRARILREIPLPGVPEITNPTWSPDGRTLVFSGTRGGFSDLYSLDLETGATRQLTTDWYADLMPSFSPDGRQVAFVTDRGPEADRAALQWGSYRIALLDLATGAVRILPQTAAQPSEAAGAAGFHGQSINPSWTRDGRGLYFISNRTGIPNIYRTDVATGELFQVTRLFGGVSGITDLSPAFAVAKSADRLVFTAYEEGGYNIYSLAGARELAGAPVPAEPAPALALSPQAADSAVAGEPAATNVPRAAAVFPAVLPPAPRPTGEPFNRVANLVRDPAYGRPSPARDTAYTSVPYRPSFSLDYLGQPQVGVSTGGGFSRGGLYGGVAGIWSDQLGRHTLFGALSSQGQLDEIGFSTAYLYRRNRWNYGALAQRVPYIYGYFRSGYDQQRDAVVDQRVAYRVFDWRLQGLAQYPFSQVKRVEFSAGVRRIAQDFQIQESVSETVRDAGGRIVGLGPPRYNERDEDGNSFNLAEASAALVHDESLFGYTSPFAGKRYRFEISPTAGEIQFVRGLADYRQYFFVRPFTLAMRGYHFGRYGRDSGDRRIFNPLFLGSSQLIRGYSYSSLRDECLGAQRAGDEAQGCNMLGQLFGSKIAVANAELRFPLVRALVLGVLPVGFPPIEGIAFLDAGVAWGTDLGDQNTRPVFTRGLQTDPLERGVLTSGGVGARVNLFGYLILEVDYVNAFERDLGWHWQFALQPGF